MKSHLIGLQVPVMSMVRPPPPPKIVMTSGDHVRVGEWIEVDHCYSVGICSDGGIAVVVAFDENGFDVRYVNPNPFCHWFPAPSQTPSTTPKRYVLDGRQESNITINRLTPIPMPIRGTTATLSNRPGQTPDLQKEVPKSKFATMSSIDVLKWGLQFKRNVSKGWLRDVLVREQILNGSKAATQARFWSDYKAQDLFMQGMQACMGDDFDPRISKQTREADGHFGQNKNGVPQNFLTVKYILHAYDISYTTYKRMKKTTPDLPKLMTQHPNKGKSIFEDKEFAQNWYSPYRMYVRLKFAEWMQTDVGRNADKQRKRVLL
jgi:hypothetical protein